MMAEELGAGVSLLLLIKSIVSSSHCGLALITGSIKCSEERWEIDTEIGVLKNLQKLRHGANVRVSPSLQTTLKL